MLEIFIIIVLIFLIFTVGLFFLKVIFFLLLVLIAATGLYALIYGAPFLPIKRQRLKAVLKLGEFGKGDRVVDLGAGDGRLIAAIAEEGVTKAVGMEFSIPTYLLACYLLRNSRAQILYHNFWHEDLKKYNKVVCFLLESSMQRFEEEIWPQLKKGTVVISNEFPLKGLKHEAKSGRVYKYVKK